MILVPGQALRMMDLKICAFLVNFKLKIDNFESWKLIFELILSENQEIFCWKLIAFQLKYLNCELPENTRFLNQKLNNCSIFEFEISNFVTNF